MFNHPYVMEKLMELDAERVARVQHYPLPARPRRDNSLLRSAGRALRTLGEGMESWAAPNETPPGQHDYRRPDAKHC